MFINEKRSENLLVNDIKKKFGNDIVLILGNWSMNKKGIKSISVPNKKYEKVLNRNFITLKINEFRTPSPFQGFIIHMYYKVKQV